MSKEAMTLALELFEQFGRDSRLKYEHQAIYKTIVALKEALAKQEQGEPLCTAAMFDDAFLAKSGLDPKTPLYTTPQPAQNPWVGLTDEELRQIWYDDAPVEGGTYVDKLRQVEAKLKEKNT